MKFQWSHYREFIKELFSSLTRQYLHIKRNYALCPLCTREPRTYMLETGCNIDERVSACALYIFTCNPFPPSGLYLSVSVPRTQQPREEDFKGPPPRGDAGRNASPRLIYVGS